MDIKLLDKRITVMQALSTAYKAVEAGKVAEAPEPVDLEAQKTSARNIALANDPATLKGQLLGTLTTAPTLTVKGLEALGFDTAEAEDVIATAAKTRIDGFALSPIAEK